MWIIHLCRDPGWYCVHVHMFVVVCVRVREREGGRGGNMIDTVYFESFVIYFYINCTLSKPSTIIVMNIVLYYRSKASKCFVFAIWVVFFCWQYIFFSRWFHLLNGNHAKLDMMWTVLTSTYQLLFVKWWMENQDCTHKLMCRRNQWLLKNIMTWLQVPGDEKLL